MSSKKSSTSFTSLYLFQFFFLFLLMRFLRLLTKVAGSVEDFKCKKPGCEYATRFNLLAAAMLRGRRDSSSSVVGMNYTSAICREDCVNAAKAMELLWQYRTRFTFQAFQSSQLDFLSCFSASTNVTFFSRNMSPLFDIKNCGVLFWLG